MGYVEKNLLKNETIIILQKPHWMIYRSVVYSIAIFGALAYYSDAAPVWIGLGFLFALPLTILTVINRKSTELAITSKRIIVKTGLIGRSTTELNHNQIESLSINQSDLGRMFNYGTITFHGTGGVKTPVKDVDNPLEFRKQVLEMLESTSP